MQHLENLAYLTVQPQKTEFSNVFWRKYTGLQTREANSDQIIWQIQVLSPNLKERFGPIKKNDSNLILRHYFTGNVLCVDEEEALMCMSFDPKCDDP